MLDCVVCCLPLVAAEGRQALMVQLFEVAEAIVDLGNRYRKV